MALLFALACVFANGFFVAAEFALAKVRPTALEARAKTGDRAALRALTVQRQLYRYLTATQLGITLASLGLGWVGEPALANLVEAPLVAIGATDRVVHGVALTLAFAVLTIFHIVVGELVPKSLALRRPERIARYSARMLQTFFVITFPALWVLNVASNFTLRLLGLPHSDYAEGALSSEELALVIRASFHGGGLDDKKRELLERVLQGTDRTVRSIMVPRVDVVTLALADPLEVSLAKVRKHGFSRYPVSEDGSADRIAGYVYVKDLLMAPTPPRDGLRTLKRDVLYVPEARTVGDLLSDVQRKKIPIAIVVDEYGGTSGLVTLEDLVEEIVGEIQDELDVEQARIQSRDDGTVVVDGSLSTTELKIEGLTLPPLDGGDTIGGYIVASLGRLARPGDRVRFGEYIAVVEDVRRRRVSRVAFRKQPATMPPPAEQVEDESGEVNDSSPSGESSLR